MISVSRPFSLVSVVIRRPPRQPGSVSSLSSVSSLRSESSSSESRGASWGRRAAASRTLSLPVTTSDEAGTVLGDELNRFRKRLRYRVLLVEQLSDLCLCGHGPGQSP